VLTARIGSHVAAVEFLRSKAAEYAASDQGRGGYVRMPTTWLNQQGYDDTPEAWKDKMNGNNRPVVKIIPPGETDAEKESRLLAEWEARNVKT
jgi:hypothetical protein